MKSITTKTTITAGLVLLTAIALAADMKQSSAVKDSYFDPDTDKLRELPANLVIVRPTHFPESAPKIRHVHGEEGNSVTRTLGRDVSFRETIAEAYDCNPMRVALPAGAPTGGFDFLATTGSNAREDLQAAIREQLGYTVRRETQNVDVLLLKTEGSHLHNITASSDDEKPDATYEDGKLHFKHQQLSVILNGLSAGLRQPVLDRTGLTNYYDFSVPWNPDIEQSMHEGTFDPEGVKKLLASWGLRLERDTVPLEMFVVEKAQ